MRTNKGKAIIGIAMAAIMIASVFAVIAPISARNTSTGAVEEGDIVYQGERLLDISTVGNVATTKILYGIKDSTADGAQIVVSDPTNFTVPSTAKTGPYNSNSREVTTAELIVDKPEITAGVFIEGTTDSVVGKSIPRGTKLQIRVEPNFGGIIVSRDGKVSQIKVKIDEPGGTAYEYTKLTNASAQEIIVDTTAWGTGAPTLDTTDWDTGTWKVKVTTDKSTCNDLDISSADYAFTVRAEELSIEAEEDEVGKSEDMILTVNGNPNTYYYTIVTGVDTTAPPAIKTGGDVKKISDSGATKNLAAWLKTGSDGLAEFKIGTTGADDRSYTIKVYKVSTTPVYPNFVPDDQVVSTDDDDVKVKVVEATVTFDIPTKVIIGEDVDLKGAISAGNKVDVIIKDERIVKTNKAVDENNEFSVEWETDGFTTGSYTVEVYIDFKYYEADGTTVRDKTGWTPANYAGEDPDGKTVVRLIEPGLSATQPRTVVAEDDDYTFEGTATGVDDVDYVLVGPKGWKSGYDIPSVLAGFDMGSTSVSDDEFDEDITMTDGLDTGVWVAVVMSPGRDGFYEVPGEVGAGSLTWGDLGVSKGKSQTQIMEIIEDVITRAGSDDIMKTLSFKVESGYVRLNPVEDVGIGEPLEITGTTNREPDTSITISTFAGPTDLLALCEVEWTTADKGTFSATIDTSDAVEGTYTLEADDGDGNTDTVTVNIGAAPTPTAPPPAGPTATPQATLPPPDPPTATPTAAPTPTPEEPGFEAVFAIAGLLAVAYLVLRIKK